MLSTFRRRKSILYFVFGTPIRFKSSIKFVIVKESEDLRDRWVKAINTIIDHHKKLNKNRKKHLGQVNESWKWDSSANKEISEQIKI